MQMAMQKVLLAPAERPVYRRKEIILSASSSGATCKVVRNRSLRWSYRNWWLLVSYKQVAPLELKRRAGVGAVSRADDDAVHRADCRAVIVEMSV